MNPYLSILLSSAIVAAIISSSLAFIFDRWKDSASRKYKAKEEAYTKAIAAIAGIADDAFSFLLRNYVDIHNNLQSIAFIEYRTKVRKDIALAILVGNEEVRTLLREIDPLIITSGDIIRKIMEPVRKGKKVSERQQVENGYAELAKRIDDLETKIILAMHKDLGIE